MAWIQYDTDKPTLQWENSVADDNGNFEIIQSYGNDVRYPAFQAKIGNGEIIPVLFEHTDGYIEGNAKMQAASEVLLG